MGVNARVTKGDIDMSTSHREIVEQIMLGHQKQNKLDARLLDCMGAAHPSETSIDRLLREGANPNAIGVTWDEEKEPSKDFPLIWAINKQNEYAVQELIKKGADVCASDYRKIPAISLAVLVGNEKVVNMLLTHEPKLIDVVFNGRTLLHLALIQLTSYSIINHGECESKDIYDILLKRFQRDFSGYYPPKVPDNLVINYKGNKSLISLLLNKKPNMVSAIDNNGMTPLDIVTNPITWKHIFYDANGQRTIRCITLPSDPNTHLLTFLITLSDILVGDKYPATLNFDFTDLRLLFQKVQQTLLSASTQQEHHVMQRLETVQRQLDNVSGVVQNVTEVVQDVRKVGNYDRKDAIESFTAALKTHQNAEEAYKRIQIALEAIRTGALAVASGRVTVGEGRLSIVASALGLGESLVKSIPIIGEIASVILKLGSAGTKKLDEIRQTNLSKNIAAMATNKEAKNIFESVARKLTEAYFEQFEKIATKELAKAKMGTGAQAVKKVKGKMLNSRFISPTEQVIAFAIIWMVDEVFNEANNLDEKIAEVGLEAMLLNVITQRKSAEKLRTFWNQVTEKLTINAIQTMSGETWHPCDFWTMPGIAVPLENNTGYKYFMGNKNDPRRYGWRLGNLQDVAALELRDTQNAGMFSQHMPLQIQQKQLALKSSAPSALPYVYPSTPARVQTPPLYNISNVSGPGFGVPVTFGYNNKQSQAIPQFNPELSAPSAPVEDEDEFSMGMKRPVAL